MAGKRRNGEGSWGSKTIKGVTYKYFRNSDGKYFYGKTEKEIRQKIKNWEQSSKKTKQDTDKELFQDYVLNWISELKRLDVKQNTTSGYESCINGQLINYKHHKLGRMQVGSITTKDIQKYYISMAEHYSRGTIKKNYAILSQCIAAGNKQNHFAEKIQLDEIKLPNEDVVAVKERKIHFLTEEDMDKLYQESQRVNTPGFNFGGKLGESTYGNNANLIVFIMYTGLRISEALNLKWENVIEDGENAKIKIIKSKTKKGERIVPLPLRAKEMINIQKQIRPKYKKDDFVFVSKTGKQIGKRNVNTTLTRMMQRANCSIPDCTPHELRHSYGSLLLKKGVDIKVVSTLLGHTDISMTYNIYIHILEEQQIDAVNLIDKIGI